MSMPEISFLSLHSYNLRITLYHRLFVRAVLNIRSSDGRSQCENWGSHGTIAFFKLGLLVRTTKNFREQPEMQGLVVQRGQTIFQSLFRMLGNVNS